MAGKKRKGGDRLGKHVQRTKPETDEMSKDKKAGGQFGRRASPKSTSKAPPLSAEERMLRAIFDRRD